MEIFDSITRRKVIFIIQVLLLLQVMMLSITRGTMKLPPLAILCPCSLLFGYVLVELHDIPVLSEAQHFVTIVSNHILNLELE